MAKFKINITRTITETKSVYVDVKRQDVIEDLGLGAGDSWRGNVFEWLDTNWDMEQYCNEELGKGNSQDIDDPEWDVED